MDETTIFPPLCDVCRNCTKGKRIIDTDKYNCKEAHIPDGNGNCKYHELDINFRRM